MQGTQQVATDEFLPSYWVVREVVEIQKANATRDTKKVPLDVGGNTLSLSTPIIANTAPLKSGDEVMVLKGAGEDDEEPARKKLKGGGRGAGAKAKGSSKSTAKAKGKRA